MAFRLSRSDIREAFKLGAVSDAVEAQGRSLRDAVNRLGAADGVEMDADVEFETQRDGRRTALIISPNLAQEWGTSTTGRSRIMGRAAQGA